MVAESEHSGGLTAQQRLGLALRNLRKQVKGRTQKDAADSHGVDEVTWRRYEAGARDLPFSELDRLAESAGHASRDQLIAEFDRIGGDSSSVALFPKRRIIEPAELPIRDRVQAGAWLLADDLDQRHPRMWPAVRDPRFPSSEQWLAEVVGDSMNDLKPAPILEGDLVHCVDAINYFARTGDIVEVERRRYDGRERELTLKQVEVTSGGLLLWPRSTNPLWREPLEILQGAGEGGDVEVRIRSIIVAMIRRFSS